MAPLLQKSPNLTPDQVEALLMQSAYKNLVPYTTATDPVTAQTCNSVSGNFYLVNDPSAVWGSNAP